ncbi:MAG: hypothetical protein HY835_00755, partial [Anaerolineae bacterium]|nr:hypothetical protein [Anaerolineae bacterium]
LGAAAGAVNTISLSLVGCFPMNDLKSHTRAAMVFFRSGLIMVLFFIVATLLQPVGNEVAPRYTLWFALLTFVAYAAFLVRLRGKSVIQSGEVNIHERRIKERPAFWALAMLEWAIFAANLVWFLSVSAALI